MLEHVKDPKQFLINANKLLKNKGILVLSTLDIATWFPKLLGKNWPWIMPMHLYYFDSKGLEVMFKDAGFKITAIKSYRHYASIRYIYQKLCYIFPERITNLLLKLEKVIPNIIIPVTLGDIKLYIACKKKK